MSGQRIIIGQVITEKAENQKAGDKRVYTLKVDTRATKIDIKHELKQLYDLEATTVRIVRSPAKTRQFGKGKSMQKRHPFKKAFITLKAKSKPLDLVSFKV